MSSPFAGLGFKKKKKKKIKFYLHKFVIRFYVDVRDSLLYPPSSWNWHLRNFLRGLFGFGRRGLRVLGGLWVVFGGAYALQSWAFWIREEMIKGNRCSVGKLVFLLGGHSYRDNIGKLSSYWSALLYN